MDKNFSIMEPCCIDSKLPKLLRQYQWLPWQSNGDITIDKILKAVSHLAGNRLDVTLCVPQLEVESLRVFRWYQQRGWLQSLTILTAADQGDMIRNELPKELELTVADSDMVTDSMSMLVMKGEKATVVVCGPMLQVVTPGLCSYTSYVGNDQDRIGQLTDAVMSRIRVEVAKKARKAAKKGKTEEAPAETPSEAPETPDETPETVETPETPKNDETESEEPTEGVA